MNIRLVKDNDSLKVARNFQDCLTGHRVTGGIIWRTQKDELCIVVRLVEHALDIQRELARQICSPYRYVIDCGRDLVHSVGRRADHDVVNLWPAKYAQEQIDRFITAVSDKDLGRLYAI